MFAAPLAHVLRQRRRAMRAAVEDAADLMAARFVVIAGDPGQRLGQVLERRVSRRGGAGDPSGAAARELLFEARQHPGADQRALAAAGVAMHDEQALPDEPVDDLVEHALAAEEDRPFLLRKRTQAWIWLPRQHEVEHIGDAGRGPAHNAFCASILFLLSQSCTLGTQGGCVQSSQSIRKRRAASVRLGMATPPPTVSSSAQGSMRRASARAESRSCRPTTTRSASTADASREPTSSSASQPLMVSTRWRRARIAFSGSLSTASGSAGSTV